MSKLHKHFNHTEFQGKSERLIRFVELYLETEGDHRKAWIDAGYSQSTLPTAMAKLRENWAMVDRMIRDRIGSHVPLALAGIVRLATEAKNDSTRLKACQDLLSRAGYDKAQEIVVTEKKAEEMEDTEVQSEILSLLKANGLTDMMDTLSGSATGEETKDMH